MTRASRPGPTGSFTSRMAASSTTSAAPPIPTPLSARTRPFLKDLRKMPRFLKNKWLWIGLAVILLVVVGFMFMQQGAAAKKAEQEKAAAEKIESPYAAIANGKADVEGGIIQVAARRGGVVKAVYVQEGDRVTAGQIRARQEDDEPRLALQRAQAEVAQAESQLRAIQVDINSANREHDRLARLVETNFVAAARMDEARDTIATAEARLASQQAAVQTARARLN